jgi:hypothetical protein
VAGGSRIQSTVSGGDERWLACPLSAVLIWL